ncbi:MAG TPA: phosphatase PAP2 family protein, partial [Gemmatales bacterium]|nr:phosphatase PAP2 family protein [Gemmatales bacterium]
PVGFGPLPSVTIGLTQEQIDRADAVINWNATAIRAVWTAGTSPTHASRVYAMVGVAVYNAVNAIQPIAEHYPVPGLTGRPLQGASAEAAAIAAANSVLLSLFPAQSALFEAQYQYTMANVQDGLAKTRGIDWGNRVAQAVIHWRSTDDIRPTIPEYVPEPPGGVPGGYQLTPGVDYALTPQWGSQTTWALTSGRQFLSPPQPALDSQEYADDFNEVKAYGGVVSEVRTPDQVQLSHFWADVPGTSGTPPGHMNEIAQRVSLMKGLTLAENARLFGLLNIGLADAAINCWEAKYVYNLWRPVSAIRDPRANEINPLTESDPDWTPLWASPGFPAYTSGHSTYSGTAAAILTSLFGPNFAFSLGSDDMPGVIRHFDSFLHAAQEAANSRLYGGIHFRFDNQAGLEAGLQIGNYVAQNFMIGRRGSAYLQIHPFQTDHLTLFIAGSNRADLITLTQHSNQYLLNLNGQRLRYDLSSVQAIQIHARDGNDRVLISKRVTQGVTVYGGNGHDLIRGGSGNDFLHGGAGNDRIFGGNGNDTLIGGPGKNLLRGGRGNNQIIR